MGNGLTGFGRTRGRVADFESSRILVLGCFRRQWMCSFQCFFEVYARVRMANWLGGERAVGRS